MNYTVNYSYEFPNPSFPPSPHVMRNSAAGEYIFYQDCVFSSIYVDHCSQGTCSAHKRKAFSALCHL